VQQAGEFNGSIVVGEKLRCGHAQGIDRGEGRGHPRRRVSADRSRELGGPVSLDLEGDWRVGSPRDSDRISWLAGR
jgi:hypothetical protein